MSHSVVLRWSERVVGFCLACALSLLLMPCFAQSVGTWVPRGPFAPFTGRFQLFSTSEGEVLMGVAGGQVIRSVDGGETWSAFGPADVYGLACDPQGRALYALNADALYRSEDGGESWSEQAGQFGYFTYLEVDPNNPQVVLAWSSGPSAPLRRSEDGGATWEDTVGLPTWYVSNVVFDPKRPGIVWASGGGVCRSDDGGKTWTQTGTNQGLNKLFTSSKKEKVLYGLDISGALVKSKDFGATWKLFGPGAGGITTCNAFATDPANGSVLYAALGEYLYRSADGGRTWKQRSYLSGGTYDLLIGSADRTRIYASGSNRVYRSSNSGKTFKLVHVGSLGVGSLALDPIGGQVMLAGGVGLYRSENGGQTWRFVGLENLNVTAVAFSRTTPQTAVAGTTGGPYFSTDGGQSWRRATGDVTEMTTFEAVTVQPSRNVFFAGGSGLYTSTDGGVTWQENPIEGFPTGFVKTVTAIAFDPFDPDVVLIALFGAGIARSVDGGVTWLLSGFRTMERIEDLIGDPHSPGLFFAASTSAFRSTDGGILWVPAGLSGKYVRSLEADPLVPGTYYAGLCSYCSGAEPGGQVRFTTDYGGTWGTLGEGLPSFTPSTLLVPPCSGSVTAACSENCSTPSSTYVLAIQP